MTWIIDNRPDKNIEPDLLEHIAREIETKNPQTVLEYAKILRLERSVVDHWFNKPLPQRWSKFGRRRRLLFNCLYPELAAAMTT